VLRYMDGKIALIFDHSGTFVELGRPEDIIITSLPKESDGLKDDSSYFKETPIEKVAKKCGKCNYMKPPGMYVCQ